MPAQIFLFGFLVLISSPSFARGPAVEDFVGIEVEEPTNLHGAELLYNLEQDVTLITQTEKTPEKLSSLAAKP